MYKSGPGIELAPERHQRRASVDTGISGARDRRHELDRLMEDAYKRRFDRWRFRAASKALR
jgi:hypothetical protein